MIFLTVGTQFPFDRLVQAIDGCFDQGLINDELFAQTGDSSYKPRNFTSVPSLDKQSFDDYLKQATQVIGHAGMGTISLAMQYDKPLLVMPRRKIYKEVVNDHQVDIALRLEKMGHLLLAKDIDELPKKLQELRTFKPNVRRVNPEPIIKRIREFLENLT